MAAIYGRKIRKGELTIENVPERWRQATIDWLATHPE
jgi:hypothetical protein